MEVLLGDIVFNEIYSVKKNFSRLQHFYIKNEGTEKIKSCADKTITIDEWCIKQEAA